MSEALRKVNIIGHLHPDTDSICSAISLAYLKNTVGKTGIYEARRAGTVNRETAFVLKHFGFEEPEPGDPAPGRHRRRDEPVLNLEPHA